MAKEFHPLGARIATGETRNGVSVGVWASTYPDGSKASEITYDDEGNGIGVARQWFQDGTLQLELEFSNDGEDIVQRTYFAGGQKAMVTTMVQGIPHGPVKRWYPSGALQSEGHFHLGRAHGEVRDFGPSGQEFTDVFRYGISRDKGFSLLSVLQGGLLTLIMLIVVAV